jgi:predicted O-methyltransferase YrrM
VTLQARVAALTLEQDRLVQGVAQLHAAAVQAPVPTRLNVPPLLVPPGHYYSPIVDPDELRRQGFVEQRQGDRLQGIEIDLATMEALFADLMAAYGAHRLPVHADASCRYYSDNNMYGVGDATILSALLRHFRPKRWIEVGSGFSSAVLLDTLDRTPGLETRLTFIEPYPDRLDALLRGTDRTRVTIIQAGVQSVPLNTFDALEAGDVLFLDTTHVAKTGSDVNHEFFQIMPRLASGVIIHLHDIFADLEYPEDWIFQENRSWNEQYLLRAFLMCNRDFEILYFNDLFARERGALVEARCPALLTKPGGGFWMRKR